MQLLYVLFPPKMAFIYLIILSLTLQMILTFFINRVLKFKYQPG